MAKSSPSTARGKSKLFRAALVAALVFFLFPLATFAQVVRVYYRDGATSSAADARYDQGLANHLARWLGERGVKAEVVSEKKLAAASAPIILVHSAPTPEGIAVLKQHVKKGGKIISFFSSSEALAEIMGVELGKWRKATRDGEFSAFTFGGKTYLQTSSNIMEARAKVGGKASIAGVWRDRAGRETGVAWISSPAGFWFTHIFSADGDARGKGDLLLSLLASCDAKYKPLIASANQKRAAEISALRALSIPRGKPGEIRGLWENSGEGLYPGDWRRTCREAKAFGFTDLFVNAQSPSFAAAVTAAHAEKIRIHAWFKCFERNGKWLNPQSAHDRKIIRDAIEKVLQNYNVNGIHLDYIRYPLEVGAAARGPATAIDSFVAEVRALQRRLAPGAWVTAAVFGEYPSCIKSVGQDWERWLSRGLIDYALPMNYSENLAYYEKIVRRQTRGKWQAQRIVGGIGVTAAESRLGGRELLAQVATLREREAAGFAIYDLDFELFNDILPNVNLR